MNTDLTFPLTAQTTYWYYDGPQVFSAVDSQGTLYLVMAVSETETQKTIFLATPLTQAELILLEKGIVDMREAFLGKTVYRFTYTEHTQLEIQHIVPEAWLPDVGVKLTSEHAHI